MTSSQPHALPEGALRLPDMDSGIGSRLCGLFVSLFLSSLSREERFRQKVTGEAPVFNAPSGDDNSWPSYLFDQYWPR